ncbi:MAG: SRPBCC family protein [Chitinophagales bacterium]
MENEKNNTKDRELIISRTLNAAVELVWEVWTRQEHLANWWGPNGFTCTISKMELIPGGEWELVLHGPDGTDYKNESIFREVIPLKKIVYEHVSAPRFVATIDFQEEGEQTHLRWHMLFPTAEEFIRVVKTFKADEGLKQNMEKLNLYLTRMNAQSKR